MRIVVDTNIVFSSILNTNSRMFGIFLQPKTSLNFFSTERLLLGLYITPKMYNLHIGILL